MSRVLWVRIPPKTAHIYLPVLLLCCICLPSHRRFYTASIPQASKHYLTVARSMKQYEDDMYTGWKVKMEETLPLLLKKTVLSKPPPTPLPASTVQTPMPGDSRSTSQAANYSYILPPGIHEHESLYTVHVYVQVSIIICSIICLPYVAYLSHWLGLNPSWVLHFQDSLSMSQPIIIFKCFHPSFPMWANGFSTIIPSYSQ